VLRLIRYIEDLPLKYILMTIFVLSLIVRLIYLLTKPLAWSHELRFGDEPLYHGLAINLLFRNGYTFKGEPCIYPPPLYSMFIALIYHIFGISPPAVRVVQTILGSLLCMLLSLWAAKIWGKKAGIFVGVFFAFNYTFVRMPFFLRSENLYFFLFITATMITWYLRVVNQRWKSISVLSGILWALSVLTREIAKPIAYLIILWIALYSNWRKSVLLLITMLIVTFPWSIRNHLVLTKISKDVKIEKKLNLPFLLKLLPGGLLYISFGPPGQGPRLLGDWNIGPDIQPPDFPADIHPTEKDDWLTLQTLNYIRSNPKEAIINRIPRKFINILMPFQESASIRVKILLTFWYLCLLILSIPMIWQALRSSYKSEKYYAELVLIVALFTIIFHTIFFGVVRYRYPIDILLHIAIGRWVLKLQKSQSNIS
jgi:hypothetical protein